MPIHVFAASDNFTGGSEASGDIRHAFLSTARALDARAFAAAPLPFWPNAIMTTAMIAVATPPPVRMSRIVWALLELGKSTVMARIIDGTTSVAMMAPVK